MEKFVVGSFVFLLLLPGVLMKGGGASAGQLCMGGPTYTCDSPLMCDSEDNHCKRKADGLCTQVGGDYCLKNGQCKNNNGSTVCVCNDGYTKSMDLTMCVLNPTTQMTQGTPTAQMTQGTPTAQMTQGTPTAQMPQGTPTAQMPQGTPQTTQGNGGCTVVVSLTLLTASLLATGLL